MLVAFCLIPSLPVKYQQVQVVSIEKERMDDLATGGLLFLRNISKQA